MSAIQEHTKVGYDYRNQNGAGVWLPPNIDGDFNNLKRIDPYNDSITQLYPIGAIGVLDKRKFAYCKAGDTLQGWARLLVDENDLPGTASHTDDEGFEGEVLGAHAAGLEYVTIEDPTARVVDYYADAYLTLFNADGIRVTTIRIAASDLGGGSTATGVKCYLDNPLPWALVNHDWCDAYRSIYSNITEPDSTHFEAFMGVALCAVTSAYYFWMQIAGPVWLAQYQGSLIPGYVADYRDVYAWFDGTVRSGDTSGVLQRVGYGLGSSAAVAAYGDTFVMLQLG